MNKLSILPLIGLLGIVGCAETPQGPTQDVWPAQGKPWAKFSQEKQYCESQALASIDGQAEQRNNRAIIGGVVTTVLGAGLGAAIGGGSGAGIGAGAGALAGGGGGALYSSGNNDSIQNMYNATYLQCMTSFGNVAGRQVITRTTVQQGPQIPRPMPYNSNYEAPQYQRYYPNAYQTQQGYQPYPGNAYRPPYQNGYPYNQNGAYGGYQQSQYGY